MQLGVLPNFYMLGIDQCVPGGFKANNLEPDDI